ncbi:MULTISPECIES: enoyl-CoA hydratase/isomerase family protein [unclassified Sphingobium]|uniref:enoyl-CoA hydratase/isomerase family protein n=1 Tax=unclassified Sphingobium TaxID=2611147 RepID=UPI00191B55D2|nr:MULTISPECIES: enoyl-CoA hydratase/isomerase family protein [unclassified Sphingobium]CAD7337960.1 Enoyl-CoA-hydratase [Sphingobium sp. S8]CAD7339002.1 Enoyl-CoA-hydratase [Sphingobium sp. S6]
MTEERVPGVYIDKVDGIATVLLHNPSVGNALTREIYEGLRDAWAMLDRDSDVRVVIFTASGSRHFCTGADVSVLTTQGELRRPGERTGEAWRLTWVHAGFTKPVIVSVNGTAAGGGLGFVVDGDIVFAARHARFMDTHVNVGQICGYGALRLAGIIGASEAKRIALAGGVLGAERAHALGLVNELYDTAEDSLAAAMTAARKVAEASPAAVRETFGLLRALSKPPHESAVIAAADRALDAHMRHPDASEGARAWTEKRAPQWQS